MTFFNFDQIWLVPPPTLLVITCSTSNLHQWRISFSYKLNLSAGINMFAWIRQLHWREAWSSNGFIKLRTWSRACKAELLVRRVNVKPPSNLLHELPNCSSQLMLLISVIIQVEWRCFTTSAHSCVRNWSRIIWWWHICRFSRLVTLKTAAARFHMTFFKFHQFWLLRLQLLDITCSTLKLHQ